ncbi:MAG: tetratricopeptide repeat protein, partial [Myxococcaceae bacterium]
GTAAPVTVAVEPDAGFQELDAGAGTRAAAVTEADAGVNAAALPAVAEDAGTTAAAGTKAAPVRGFDEYVSLGDRLRVRERYDSALDAYDKAIALKPDRAEPVAGRGLTLLDLGQRSEAESAFREALRLNPRYAVAVMGLAETYRHMGRNTDAIEYYKRYLDILPNGPEAPVAKAALERLKE